jgi:hypothetical protein
LNIASFTSFVYWYTLQSTAMHQQMYLANLQRPIPSVSLSADLGDLYVQAARPQAGERTFSVDGPH